MLEKNFQITPNEFYTTNAQSVLKTVLAKNNVDAVAYGYIFVGYPNWNQFDIDIDLFQYLDPEFLDKLRQTKTLLLVDYTFEGFSPVECPIICVLEENCKKYDINPKKIFYFSGNLKDKSNIINVIPIYLLDYSGNFDMVRKNFVEAKNKCLATFQDKIFLSLSRRNRPHRVLAHAMLVNSSLKEYAIISQDELKDITVNDHTLEKIGYTRKQWRRFSKTLPLIADSNQFHINDPFNILSELHCQTAFSVVNETLVHDYNSTSLFYSEKILKPIINFQPMVIYGQPGINHALKELGFQLYDDYFDLSFDFEPDHILRYKKLLHSLEPLVAKLSTLTMQERVQWRFSRQDVLNHNFDNFLSQTHSKNATKLFAARILEL